MHGTHFPLEIQPRVPAELHRLEEMANDLTYSWDRAIRSLFVRLDRKLWSRCGHSPKLFMRQVSQELLDRAVQDSSYMENYRRITAAYDAYMERGPHPELAAHFDPDDNLVAYFCLEFGFHESFPIYSGGLGILAGDHCKAASDMGLPFVAVGLLYRVGYFNQQIDAHGHQIATYRDTHPHDLPVTPTLNAQGEQLQVSVQFPGREVRALAWTARAGHITLFLLDTNLPSNSPQDRNITRMLYGGDREMRLQQEMLLGVGGVNLLKAMSLKPTVWHINEGHAAFQLLARCAQRVRDGMNFAAAMELVASGTVFTTHTPVPAGHDIFDEHLVRPYLEPLAQALDQPVDSIYALGLDTGTGFNMTSLALRCSRFHNGVSAIHGGVASQMEASLWPQIPVEDNPITHITNGVHLQTFLAREWEGLLDLHFDDWRRQLFNIEYWQRIDDIPAYQHWSVHLALKRHLLKEVCERVEAQQRRNGSSDSVINHMLRYVQQGLEQDLLVMGFARRFATYKRALMLFRDPDRLARLLDDPEKPTVILFAGKAHPHDEPGQHLIRSIHELSMQPRFLGKILLLENYDMALARHLVSGVDVWLNTPEYPLEASGTSGQKAALNGVINLSVLDGWWAEGYDGTNGYAITPRPSSMDHEQRYREEATDLLDTLEHQLMPTYFRRDMSGHSPDWVGMSKASMRSILPRFNAQRMLMDYVRKLYAPAREKRLALAAHEGSLAEELAQWKQRVRNAWPGVGFELMVQPPARLYQDESFPIAVRVSLNGLEPADICVECLLRHADESEELTQTCELLPGDVTDGSVLYRAEICSQIAGAQHYRLRLYPRHAALCHRFEHGCMFWV